VSSVGNVLVVGCGLAGAATAILLAEHGVAVDLLEIMPDIAAIGSGITLQGNALRELHKLGVWDRVEAHGYGFDSTGIRAPDPDGTLVLDIPGVRTGGPDLPAFLGIPRPDLARIMVDRAIEVGAKVRCGVTTTDLHQVDDGVHVALSDGSSGCYDLVVGADGIRSWTRRQLGIALETRAIGMGIWRVMGPRPASVTRTELYYGGPSYIAGYCPTGEDSLYAYIVEPAQDRSTLTASQQRATLRELAEAYHGPWDDIRATITDTSAVHYTWFETHVLPAPWNRGRVVLLGDAAHSCPPTLAQGGAQALEDAGVLAELLLDAERVDDVLWTAFTERRFPRATAVVQASNQLCEWLMADEADGVADLMARTTALVATPA
jgi:2-polyprenyl-6-methoxyphenol hydroxylase-like FAD-dependent oxidoreductase